MVSPQRVSLADLARTLPGMLDEATAKQRNLIVRPHGPGVTFMQLDDLTADQLPALPPPCFSPSKPPPAIFRRGLPCPASDDKEFARRVRKGAGADIGAAGQRASPAA